jgi:hypothetical protein
MRGEKPKRIFGARRKQRDFPFSHGKQPARAKSGFSPPKRLNRCAILLTGELRVVSCCGWWRTSEFEPLSIRNSLQTGKITGNFRNFGPIVNFPGSDSYDFAAA